MELAALQRLVDGRRPSVSRLLGLVPAVSALRAHVPIPVSVPLPAVVPPIAVDTGRAVAAAAAAAVVRVDVLLPGVRFPASDAQSPRHAGDPPPCAASQAPAHAHDMLALVPAGSDVGIGAPACAAAPASSLLHGVDDRLQRKRNAGFLVKTVDGVGTAGSGGSEKAPEGRDYRDGAVFFEDSAAAGTVAYAGHPRCGTEQAEATLLDCERYGGHLGVLLCWGGCGAYESGSHRLHPDVFSPL